MENSKLYFFVTEIKCNILGANKQRTIIVRFFIDMLAEIDLKCQLSCSIELKFLFIEINKALEVKKNGFCLIQ